MNPETSIKIPSDHKGWDLDAWRFIPTGTWSKPHPIIVMAHGLSANKLMGLSSYAETFSAMGYACLVFDFRRWGASDGAPRYVASVREQLEDYRTVIKYARQQPEFDTQRLILWGTSFSGGHVVALSGEASLNPVATIAQCPYLGVSPHPPLSFGFVKTLLAAVFDYGKQALGFEPLYMPAAAAPGGVGGMTTEGALEGVLNLRQDESDFPNLIAASAIFEISGYKPVTPALSITCPIIVIASENDNLCPLQAAVDVANQAQKVELVNIPDAGHFDLYPNAPHFDDSVKAQLEFLQRVVLV